MAKVVKSHMAAVGDGNGKNRSKKDVDIREIPDSMGSIVHWVWDIAGKDSSGSGKIT
jgi:hypothetical protein